MKVHLAGVRRIYERDRAAGAAGVELPHAYAVKSPRAAVAWGWHWVFPQDHLSVDPRTSILRRHHAYDETYIDRRRQCIPVAIDARAQRFAGEDRYTYAPYAGQEARFRYNDETRRTVIDGCSQYDLGI